MNIGIGMLKQGVEMSVELEESMRKADLISLAISDGGAAILFRFEEDDREERHIIKDVPAFESVSFVTGSEKERLINQFRNHEFVQVSI